MEFGAAIFFTDYSMGPVELGRALEERGFESLWAPEHSHIPLSRRSPFPQGGDLPKKYYDVMDPFVTLSAAAGATSTLKVGTGICLGARRAIAYGDGWLPHARRPAYGEVIALLPEFQKMVGEAGRDPATIPVTIFGVAEDVDLIRRYRDAGAARVLFNLPAAQADEVLPILDRCTVLIRKSA